MIWCKLDPEKFINFLIFQNKDIYTIITQVEGESLKDENLYSLECKAR